MIRIRFTTSDGQHGEESYSMPAAEWDVCGRFVVYAKDLVETALLRGPTKVSYSFKWDADSGARVDYELPEVDVLSAFLHRMRPFLLSDEPTNFYRVRKLLSRYIENDDVRAALISVRDLFSEKEEMSMVQIRSGGVLVNSDEMLTKWLNAFEYHRDEEKRVELAALHDVIPLDSSKAIFVERLIKKAEAIVRVARFIEELRGSDGEGVPEWTQLREHLSSSRSQPTFFEHAKLPGERWVDIQYPADAGIAKDLEKAGYGVAWTAESRVQRRLDIDGYERVLVVDENGGPCILRLRDRPENQTCFPSAKLGPNEPIV